MIAMAERYGIRDTALATVIKGFMYDKGIISENDRVELLDRNTVRFQRKKYREENTPITTYLNGLYFDGKKDNTLQTNGTKKIELHVLIESGSKFITHMMSPNGSSESVAKSIIYSLGLSELSHIMAIGTDGTCTNTCIIKGVITRIETYLKNKLHWNVSI